VRPRTLLVLFALVAVLGGFIWFYERKLPSTDERAEQAKKVLRFEKADVTGVTLTRGGRTVELAKVAGPAKGKGGEKKAEGEEEEGDETGGEESAAGPEDIGEWRIARPMAARADASLVSSLLDSLLALEKSRTIEDPDPRDVGLDRPQATVRLKTAEGEKVLKIGAKVPTGASVIVGFAGERQTYAVSDSVLALLDRQPGDWRDRQIVRGDRDAIERIALSGEHGRIVLARRGDGFWLESPIGDRADRDLVEGLLSDLTGLSAQTFLDDPARRPADLGLAPPKGVVEVTTKGSAAPQRIELGAPIAGGASPAASDGTGGEAPAAGASASRYARAGAQLFETQTNLTEALARPPEDWRSRTLTGLEVYQIEGVRVKDGKGELALTRAGTDWKRGKDTVSYTPVSELLFAVTGARADRLLGSEEARAAGAALDRPILTLTLKGAAGGPPGGGEETLSFYRAVPAGVPVRSSGRDAVLLVPRNTVETIQRQVAAIRAAKPVKPAKPGS
jgi:uncharacterized protein DUF4340